MGIEQKTGLNDYILSEVETQETREQKTKKEEPPVQAVRSRSSSLVEWDQSEDLWAGWKKDLEQDWGLPEEQKAKRVKASASKAQEIPLLKEKSLPQHKPKEGLEESVSFKGKVHEDPEISFDDWALELALQERKMDREGVVDCGSTLARHELLRSKTSEFTALLQYEFRKKVELFNEARKDPAFQVHLYKVSKSEEDFMLYRNSVKMVVSGREAGKIVFAFNQYLGQAFHNKQAPLIEIHAQWGAFDQLIWTHKGERVEIRDMVRYFFTEFTQQSYK